MALCSISIALWRGKLARQARARRQLAPAACKGRITSLLTAQSDATAAERRAIEWYRACAAAFLQTYLEVAKGSVFLPPEFEANEVSGSWQHGATAAVLTVWIVLGLVLCVRTFRRQRRDAG